MEHTSAVPERHFVLLFPVSVDSADTSRDTRRPEMCGKIREVLEGVLRPSPVQNYTIPVLIAAVLYYNDFYTKDIDHSIDRIVSVI